MSMTPWRHIWPRRNQEPEPVRPTLTRGNDAEIIERLAADLRTAQEDAARWKRHADTFAEERDTAVKAFNAKVLEVEDRTRERDGAYRERAQLLAWLAALHPSWAVITPASDTNEDGWHLLYLVAGGWQMSWHIASRDIPLFRHVQLVEPTDLRAQWDGHTTEVKYARIRQHVRLLALEDGPSTPVTTEPESRSA